jgi:uncharacterized protein involved in exopolysaccharide biosynthesis
MFDSPIGAASQHVAEPDLLRLLVTNWRLALFGPLSVGLLAFGVAFLIPKTYLSRAVIIPPLQQQSMATAALAQLGALSGLTGGAVGGRTPADQYVGLLQSATVADSVIDRFDLMKVYGADYRERAREDLFENVRIALSKKDGLITIEVVDQSPQRAAEMANRYVEELRVLTRRLALTEAQQRRALFESQLQQTRDRLTEAQSALQASGFSQSALRADARASAESYARLRADATAAEVQLQALRRSFADSAPEVQRAVSVLSALRSQLSRLEESDAVGSGPDYVSRFREFKYQETLFDLMARQYELARVDEAREGALVQVVDTAKPAERKHRPQRALIALASALSAFVLIAAALVGTHAWRRASATRAGSAVADPAAPH